MSIRIGIFGEAGSFSEEAAERYVKRAGITSSFRYLVDIESVLTAVETGAIDIGLVPVVNLAGGLVKPAIEAMGNHLFMPIDELWLEVNHCLLVRPGIGLHQITRVVSHPQALMQCKHYLQNTLKGIEHIEWTNTAKAAKDLAEDHLSSSTAVIASARSAALYDLDILATNIADKTPNLTAFIIVKKHPSKHIETETYHAND